MTEVLTSAQMRAIERAAIDSGVVTGLELMERAGHGVVDAILAEWPELATGTPRAVVLCGPGNNGGDGFVVARLLKGRGWDVAVFLFGDPARMPPDARVNHERWQGMGGSTQPWFDRIWDNDAAGRSWLLCADVVIDAVFGIGLTRPLGDIHSDVWQAFDLDTGSIRRLVAVDVPSGLCADSGRALGIDVADQSRHGLPGHAFQAALTVTFHAAKPGHFLADGPSLCGCLRVVDLGLAPATVPGSLGRVMPPSRRHWDKRSGHKYAHGHGLVLSGGPGAGGAARLSARGALRIGAGLVTIGCPREALAENAARLDAVMLRPVADGAALADVLADNRITALCLGPGLGTSAREAGLLAVALGLPVPGLTRDPDPADAQGGRGGPGSRQGGAPVSRALPLPLVGRGEGWGARSMVLDADALTILSQNPELFAALHKGCVLTPHAGEFARLFPDIAAKLAEPATKGPAYSKVDATRDAAARAGCVVLFKGPDTVIADPAGRCAIHAAAYDRAAPWLATAGSGDVLAGFIAGLLARGLRPFDAACTAAFLHVEAARRFGPGLIAEDLPEQLPAVFRSLGL